MNIRTFLLERIAEDETAARNATIRASDGYRPHPELSEWEWSGEEVMYVQTPEMRAHKYPDEYYVTCDHEGILPSVDDDVAPHIARHDPARVMRECAAKRQMIEHADGATNLDMTVEGDRGIGQRSDPYLGDLMLATLAACYADHPDYSEIDDIRVI